MAPVPCADDKLKCALPPIPSKDDKLERDRFISSILSTDILSKVVVPECQSSLDVEDVDEDDLLSKEGTPKMDECVPPQGSSGPKRFWILTPSDCTDPRRMYLLSLEGLAMYEPKAFELLMSDKHEQAVRMRRAAQQEKAERNAVLRRRLTILIEWELPVPEPLAPEPAQVQGAASAGALPCFARGPCGVAGVVKPKSLLPDPHVG